MCDFFCTNGKFRVLAVQRRNFLGGVPFEIFEKNDNMRWSIKNYFFFQKLPEKNYVKVYEVLPCPSIQNLGAGVN